MDLCHFLYLPISVVSLSLSPRHGTSSRLGWRNGLHTWRVAANILIVQCRTEVKLWPSSFVLRRGANKFSPQKTAMLRNYSQRGGAVFCEFGNGQPDSQNFGEFLRQL
jgi:hypothetical protein